MKVFLLQTLITLCTINAYCMDDPFKDIIVKDLTPRRSSEPIPIYDTGKEGLETVHIQHLAADFFYCSVPRDVQELERILREAAQVAGATALTFSYNKFNPVGMSAVLILGESHISVHFWHEERYALVDVVTCGSCNPYAAIELLKVKFKTSAVNIHDIIRPFK